jgi:hypothetical protein
MVAVSVERVLSGGGDGREAKTVADSLLEVVTESDRDAHAKVRSCT